MKKLIRSLTKVAMYLGFVTLAFEVLFLTVGSISRTLDRPILGDVELASLLMVVMIFLAIPYTQSVDGHVKIGLIADKLPPLVQKYLDMIASLLTLCFSILISVVYYYTAMEYLIENPRFSDLLVIPLYPFKFLILISAILWALECCLKFFEEVSSVVKNRVIIVENVPSLDNGQVEKAGE